MGKKASSVSSEKPKKKKQADSGVTANLFRGLAVGAAALGVACVFMQKPWASPPSAYARILPVPRIDASAPGALDEFFSKYQGRYPVLIENALQSWPALGWTPKVLAEKCPDARLPVYIYDLEGADWAALRDGGELPLKEYLQADFGSDKQPRKELRYALEMSMKNECPGLLEDIRIPAFFADDLMVKYYKKGAWPTLIAGPQGTRSGLHRDTHNLPFWMALFHGRKHWRVFLPDEEALRPYFNTERNGFEFDPFDPDWAKFPKLGEATVYEHELKAGELIYIPSGSPHAVRNLEDTIAISGNYLDSRHWPIHKNTTCETALWADSKLCWAFDHDFGKHKPPPTSKMKELSFFEWQGHTGPQAWCQSYLVDLKARAIRQPTVYERCIPIVDAYCSSKT